MFERSGIKGAVTCLYQSVEAQRLLVAFNV